MPLVPRIRRHSWSNDPDLGCSVPYAYAYDVLAAAQACPRGTAGEVLSRIWTDVRPHNRCLRKDSKMGIEAPDGNTGGGGGDPGSDRAVIYHDTQRLFSGPGH